MRTDRLLSLAAAAVAIACSTTDAALPPWPADGRTPALGVYEASMHWEAAGDLPAGSARNRFRLLLGPDDTLRAAYLSGPLAGDTLKVRPDPVAPARYGLAVVIGVYAPFLVHIERPGGAERLECTGGIPLPSPTLPVELPMDCTVRLIGA